MTPPRGGVRQLTERVAQLTERVAQLQSRAWRAARAIGYRRLVTRTEPVIGVEPARPHRRCLCCLSPVSWALVLGTREPRSCTEIAICRSCAEVLAPIVAGIALGSDAIHLDNPHPEGCFSSDPLQVRDCQGDGHHECRRCSRKENSNG